MNADQDKARPIGGLAEDSHSLRKRLREIEASVDSNSYRPGKWDSLIRELLSRSAAERYALADDISRVSRKLHLRRPRRRMAIARAIALEAFAALCGGALLALAARENSNAAAIVGAALWIVSFQPLLKFFFGRAAGIRYDYAYLLGVEPRLKMNFGSYVAAPPLMRIALHLSGTVGSPLGAWMAAAILPISLHPARRFCWTALWIIVGINVAGFVIGIAGIRRIGGLRASDGSGGAAALELRRAVGLRG